MPVTLSFQSTGAVPGNAAPQRMTGSTLTLGRGGENDVVLPDPDKTISKRHCAIEDHSGNIVVVDLSTNGTFLNYSKSVLGPTPTPLNDGDILSVGPYELLVTITSVSAGGGVDGILGPATEPQRDIGNANAGVLGQDDNDALADILGTGTPSGPSAVNRAIPEDEDFLGLNNDDAFGSPTAPFADQGPSQFDHSSAASDPMPPVTPSSNAIPDDWDDLFDDPPPSQPVQPQTAEAPVSVAPASAGSGGAPYFRALTGNETPVSAQEEPGTLSKMGHVTRILLEGVRDILMTRATIKNEFRIQQTVISASRNNPLKFSVSGEQAVDAFVRPTQTGYLDAVDAAQEAIDDIKAHEMATVAGMEAAVKGLLARLSPDALAGQIETSSGFGSVLKGKKARYWEVYEKIYGQIADEAEADFHEIFSTEFAKAYQAQLDKLKKNKP